MIRVGEAENRADKQKKIIQKSQMVHTCSICLFVCLFVHGAPIVRCGRRLTKEGPHATRGKAEAVLFVRRKPTPPFAYVPKAGHPVLCQNSTYRFAQKKVACPPQTVIFLFPKTRERGLHGGIPQSGCRPYQQSSTERPFASTQSVQCSQIDLTAGSPGRSHEVFMAAIDLTGIPDGTERPLAATASAMFPNRP